MCGIAGIIGFQAPTPWGSVGRAMLRRLEHRGPDDHGWLCYSRTALRAGRDEPCNEPAEVMLLHRRLSILDLTSAGHQPMSTPDGRYHLAFNGEIYNYLELRAELEAAGRRFCTRTDTEVLLAALAEWGLDALPRLVGMFAFALLDTQARTLLLARDFFGIKPLFYVRDARRLAFASEIGALLEIPGLSRRVNVRSLYEYLTQSKTDHGEETLFEQVRHLAPAHYLRIDLDRPGQGEPHAYWTLDAGDPTADLSFDEAAGRLRELFLESVRLHLRSDVAVGTALSGGIDSSSIVGAIRAVAGRQLEFHSFSFVASDPRISEERWIDLAASAAGMIVHKVSIQPDELAAEFDDLVAAQGEPFPNTSPYAQFRVFRQASEAGIKVLLDGQGSDELMAGYNAYLYPRAASLFRSGRLCRAARFIRAAGRRPGIRAHRLAGRVAIEMLPGSLRTSARRLLRRGPNQAWLDEAWFRRQGLEEREADDEGLVDELRTALVRSARVTSLPRLLRHEDRNSMHFSIESRVPFLTPALARFAISLPPEYLVGDDAAGKRVLRAAMRGIAPDAILDRKDKVGFETPDHAWLEALRPWVGRVLASDAARSVPALRHDQLLTQTESILAGRQAFDWRVWRWVNLVRWSELLGVEY